MLILKVKDKINDKFIAHLTIKGVFVKSYLLSDKDIGLKAKEHKAELQITEKAQIQGFKLYE